MSPTRPEPSRLVLPTGETDIELTVGRKKLHLTNLQKLFWPERNITKRDLLQYYIDLSPVLLPHLKNRAMVMKRYPNGAAGEFFFMKRAPTARPAWIRTCAIEHASGSIIDFPIVQDLGSLLWLINLGCIDLNQWYARCDDVHRPDYLHFDLDPVPGAGFDRVLQAALVVRDALARHGNSVLTRKPPARAAFTSTCLLSAARCRSRCGRSPRASPKRLEAASPDLITGEYRVASRPAGRVLVDYNQNAWGRTLASVYSVRPQPLATVSTPVTWEEIERGFRIEDFRIDNVPERVREIGDLWKPLTLARGRVDLERVL